MSARRILIGPATSYKAVVLARFVKQRHPGVEVFTYDSRRLSGLFHTRHADRHFVLRHPPEAGEPFVQEVLALVRAQAVDLLIPVNSAEVDLLLRSRAAFGDALAYCGDYDAFRDLNEKDRLQALAASCGCRVPARFDGLDALRLPAVAKPVVSSSAKGVRYLLRPRDLERFRARAASATRYLYQEYVRGAGVGYSVFAARGEIVAGYGHRRLAEYPLSGGSSVYRESFEDPRMRACAAAILARTGWSGFAMFEFKLARGGDLYLLEVNPRVWGSVHQGLENGADFLESLLGPAAEDPHGERRTYFSPFIYAALALYLLRGNLGPARTFLGNLRTNRADIGLLSDPRAWLGSLLRLL